MNKHYFTYSGITICSIASPASTSAAATSVLSRIRLDAGHSRSSAANSRSHWTWWATVGRIGTSAVHVAVRAGSSLRARAAAPIPIVVTALLWATLGSYTMYLKDGCLQFRLNE